MSYLGDFALGSTFDFKFTTVNTSGVPTQLAGTPVISAYPDNSTTQLTAGITLTVDFDTVTGLNNVRVVATSGNGYAAGSNYDLVITTGTVSGASVVGYVVGQFSIEARSALRPTTAGRTVDITAGGEAGIDWANIGSPTTAQTLSATNINNVQGNVQGNVLGSVGSVSGAVGSVTGNVGGNVAGSVGSVTGNVGGNVVGSVGSATDLGAAAVAKVNAEVLDVLNVDTFAQPGQATPAATTTIRLMLAYLYKAWRNRFTQTATEYDLYNDDAVTIDQKATASDDTVTFDRGEVATGP